MSNDVDVRKLSIQVIHNVTTSPYPGDSECKFSIVPISKQDFPLNESLQNVHMIDRYAC